MGKNVVQKVGIVPKIGCLIALPIIFIMAIPMIIVGGAMPVSNVMSEAECLIGDNDCEEETASYITKFRNFVKLYKIKYMAFLLYIDILWYI